VGDVALLDHGVRPEKGEPESSGLWSEEVEVKEEGAGGLMSALRKKGPAERRTEWVLAVRVVKEEGFRLSTSSEAEMEQLLTSLNEALDKLRQHSIEKKRRMIKRSSNAGVHDAEAVINELTQRLRERGAQKKTRATLLEGASAARLEGAHSSMMHSSMISKSMMAASKSIDKKGKAEAADAWVPALPFTASLSLEKLDPLPLMGKWYVTAHLPYLLERSAYAAVLTLTWDAESSLVTAETRFADGGYDGRPQRFVRVGPIDETGRDWRLRQRWGEDKLMPQTPLAVLHACDAGLMIAHSHTVVADAHNHSIRDVDEVGVSYLWLLTRASPAAGTPPVVNEMLDLATQCGFDVGAIRTVPHKE